MRIVILGGHGFMGKSIERALAAQQHDVIALSRRDGLDLFDVAVTQRLLRDAAPEVVFNCAAHVGGLHYVSARHADVAHDNMQMGLNLYRAVRDACPSALVVNPLSNCSYPGDADIYREREWLHGEVHPSVYSYGNAKRMLYVLGRCYLTQYGIRTHNFLVSNAFGPGDATDPHRVHALNGIIIRMIQAQRQELPEFEIWGSGAVVREWLYAEDAANILARSISLEQDLTYPVNIAQESGYSILESAQMVARAVGYDGKLVVRTSYQNGAVRKIMSRGRFAELFPDYRFMDHEEGIRRTVEYYRSVL